MKKRYNPTHAFPPYRFLPGREIHPNSPGGHLYEKGEPEAQKINISAPWESELFSYALDLFNHGYFWEGHVYLEALWKGHGRKGSIADFLKALIKLCAAGVKFEVEQRDASRGHLERALELLGELQKDGEELLGIGLKEIISDVREQLERTDRFLLEIHPNWD